MSSRFLLIALCSALAPSGCAGVKAVDSGAKGDAHFDMHPHDGGAITDGHMSGPPDLATSPCGSCPAATPICDSLRLKCVACLSDNDCAQGDRCTMSVCVFVCSPQRPCGDAGVCDPGTAMCFPCTNDANCTTPGATFCNKTTGVCGPCSTTNDQCAAGTYCAAGACVAGCKSDSECASAGAATSKCCAHRCDDSASSLTNCGACGTACAGTQSCCSGACADTNSPSRCGSCTNVCSLQGATAGCVRGACTIASCNNNQGDCDNNPSNGCETDLNNDDNNCGSCGNSCVFACLSGSCFPF